MVSKYEELTKLIENMISTAGSGHYASSMSALEIMYPLFYEQGVKPDCFVLSKGHAAPTLYAILYDLGYIKDLGAFRKWGGLPGHPSLDTPGILCSSGSLGMGISKAIGLALGNPHKHYHVLVGDGELQEGQNWEAFLYMAANGIENMTIHVDANGHQYSGKCHPCVNDLAGPNVVLHQTKWLHDNSYLCKPKEKDTTYSDYLMDAMSDNPDIIVLNADLEHDFGLTPVKETYPDRYIQCGICEQHMVSMANGLALAGYVPVCHTFSAFYKRAIDQMYNNYHDGINVGYVAGLCVVPPVNIGISHYATDTSMIYGIGIDIADNVEDFFDKLTAVKGGVYLEAW